jgi:hypothetical protein
METCYQYSSQNHRAIISPTLRSCYTHLAVDFRTPLSLHYSRTIFVLQRIASYAHASFCVDCVLRGPVISFFDVFSVSALMQVLEVSDADWSQQDVRKVFDDALTSGDVEKNDQGDIALHGVTYLVWTSKVPS